MRPEIPEDLEQRIEKVYRQAGYNKKGALVREAVRIHVNDLEAEHHVQEQDVRDSFEYEIQRSVRGGPEIRLEPKTGSTVGFKYVSKGNPPHTTILDTGNTYVAEDVIADSIEEIEGVEKSYILTKGAITVHVLEDNPVPLTDEEDSLVDRIYDTLDQLITEANQRVLNDEETRQEAYDRAVRPYRNRI